MTRSELCQLLALPADSSDRAVRTRVVRVASGKPELGSSPAMRKALFAALRLAPGSSDLSAARVCESILRVPLDRSTAHTRVVTARGARTL